LIDLNLKYTLVYAPMCCGAYYDDGWFFFLCHVQLNSFQQNFEAPDDDHIDRNM
jgi:hypothetical protein